jgi:N-terminal domain on NACHT_NTPase and P-loop NTPases
MSGLEVLGGISAVIAIIDGSVKVWESRRKDLKLRGTFETVGNRLPILRNILQTCHEHLEPIRTSLPADAAQSLLKTVDDSKMRAKNLDTIFQETIPGEDDRWYERYHMVARRLGKGSKVEELMRAITEDAQNLGKPSAVPEAQRVCRRDGIAGAIITYR